MSCAEEQNLWWLAKQNWDYTIGRSEQGEEHAAAGHADPGTELELGT